MAKRTPRSTAPDAGASASAEKKPRRQRASAPMSETGATPDARAGSREFDTRSATSSEAGDDAPLESMSMASEPSEEDIRTRAYHRFLERGGGHGMDFEDWLEAERELKGDSSLVGSHK